MLPSLVLQTVSTTERVIEKISISEALVLSVIGIVIVFVVLISLMIMIKATTSVVAAFEKKPVPVNSPVTPIVEREEVKSNKVPAIGSIGECLLHTVDDQTAAMLMAIVADDMKAPLNELRFISIKQV